MSMENIVLCNDCGREIDLEASFWEQEGTHVPSIDAYVCYSCIDANYVNCTHCSNTMHEDDAHYDNGEVYCSECVPPTFRYDRINGYRASPPVEFYGNHIDGRYFGIELEVDKGDGSRDLVYELYDLVGKKTFYQYDGSLDTGFEIITQPMSLDYHLYQYPWEKLCELVKGYDYRSHDTNTSGLHIHVSRKAFGKSEAEIELNIAKMVIIFERFWDKIVTFSRRDYSRLERWAKKPEYTFYKHDSMYMLIDKSKVSHSDRYSCINLQNSETVEFRVFRGTLKSNTILASIQFIDTLMDYALNAMLDNVFEDSFLDMLSNNKYQELTQYLNERGMI